MSNSKISSPARSLGVISTPRKHRFRRSHSVGSPAQSNISNKLSCIAEECRMSPFVLTPLRARRSVLSDDTYIEVPERESWYKRLDDNTGEVVEVLERREQVENVEEYIGDEILSQEKKNYTIDLPDSSDGESICSIVIPQRKLFSLKDNLQAQKLFNNVMENREDFTLRKSKSNNDKTIIVGKKDLFNRVTKKRSKSIFSANMQNVTVNKTLPNKTKDIENQGKVRNLFGNRVPDKRKNMFAEFIVSESEDEIPDIQPKVFGFPTSNEEQQPQTKNRQSTIQRVQNSSIASYISNDELDDWKLLPSSTMVENVFSITEKGTPVKRLRLSERNKTRALAEDSNINEVNKTKQSNVTPTTTNTLKSKFTNDKQFIVSQHSYINDSKNSEATLNKSNKSLMKKNTSDNEISINIKSTSNETRTSQQSSNHDSKNDSFAENIENNNVDENDFTLQYNNDEENLPESMLDENNTLQHFEDCNSGAGCGNTSVENNTILTYKSRNNIIDTNLIKSTNFSLSDKREKEKAISKMENKTLPQVGLHDNNRDSSSFQMQSQDKKVSSSSKVVEQEHLLATNIQKNNMRDVNEKTHSPLAVNLPKNHVEEPEILDYIDENNRKRNCSNHNLGNENVKNISNPSVQKEFVNINEGREEDIDSNIELTLIQNEIENSDKSNHETIYHNNIHDKGDKFDESVIRLGENHENNNLKINVEENVDSNMNERNCHSEIKGVEESNEENDQNNESDRNNTEPEGNQEEDEINDTEEDTENQVEGIEIEEDDESEEDNIDNSNTIVDAQQEEENETNSTEKAHNYSLENEKHNDKEDTEDDHESNTDNSEDDDEDGEDNDEMQNENYENADEQNGIIDKGQRMSHISSISEQSSRMLHDDVTMESDHDTSRTKRSATLKTYLMNMKKANMEKKRQTEVAIRNSIKASAPLREYNLFKAPVKPKTSHPQMRTSQSKPKVKHLSNAENLPLGLMEDLQYKPPRRYQPGNASWITMRLYKYLEDKLDSKYDYKARVRAEKLVESINNFARELRRHSVAPPDTVTRLKTEMARLGITKTHYDFYEFFHEFMPREIRVKVVPDVVNKISLPKDGIFSDILS